MGGNRKQSESIPTIPPEEPEDRHCFCLHSGTNEPIDTMVNTVSAQDSSEEQDERKSESERPRTLRFIVFVVYLLTFNFKFPPLSSLLITPPPSALRWRSERVLSPF